MASVVRLPAAGLHACDEAMILLREVVAEIAAVGRDRDVALDEDVVEKTMAFIQSLPSGATSSM